MRHRLLLPLICALGLLPTLVWALQENPSSESGSSSESSASQSSASESAGQGQSSLGVRQERIERMMADLERRFMAASVKLKETEPERSERLIVTVQTAKQLLIQKRMDEIIELLNSSQLADAGDEQGKILEDVRELIKLLLNEQDEEKREEIARLKRWKQQVENLLKEEVPQERESGRFANQEKTLKDLAAQIKAVEALIKKQKEVNSQTEDAKEQGIQALDRAANSQHEVRRETEKVEKMIGDAAKGDDPQIAKGDEPENEGQANEAAAADTDGAGADAGGEAGDGPSGGSASGSGDNPNGESDPSGQGSESDPSAQGAAEPAAATEPGQASLRKAAQNQKQAETLLPKGNSTAGQRQQKEALKNLEDALKALRQEQKRIESLPPEEFEKMAQKQVDTRDKTERLQEEMKQAQAKKDQAGESGEGGEGGQGSGGQGEKSPGMAQVQRAQKAMENAGNNLGRQDSHAANRQQKEAIKELREALREIEERLKQLREETQEEKLARLEARFTEMLARQQKVSAGTIELDSKMLGAISPSRADRRALVKLTNEELQIAELAQQAYDILIEDGTSVVFPRIVQGLQEDLLRSAELLEAQRTDGLTQHVQKEIETTIEELLEALKRTRQNRQGGGGGGGGGGNQPLLPPSAELKILKAAQLRVNRQTQKFDELRASLELDPLMRTEVQGIATRQREIIQMTEELLQSN